MDAAKKLVINIVTWNSARYLPGLFDSLDRQTSSDFTATFIDNTSTDGTPEWLAQERPDAAVLKNFRNQGFSRAHNQAIALALSRWEGQDLSQRYVMIANPDLEFDPACIEEVLKFMDANMDVASCGPKLLRAIATGEGADGRHETERTNIIDAAGIVMTKARRVMDRGAGEEDHGQFDGSLRVFGLSGACMVLRASVLQQIKMGDEYFDEDFFAYQEDVHLAWRMRLWGMEARLVPTAIAWHYRRSPSQKGGWLAAWRLRRSKSAYINTYSTRNHGWLLIKNDQTANVFMHLIWWLPYECAKVIASLISPVQMKAQFASLAGFPKMWRKRTQVMKRVTVTPEEMRKWFV